MKTPFSVARFTDPERRLAERFRVVAGSGFGNRPQTREGNADPRTTLLRRIQSGRQVVSSMRQGGCGECQFRVRRVRSGCEFDSPSGNAEMRTLADHGMPWPGTKVTGVYLEQGSGMPGPVAQVRRGIEGPEFTIGTASQPERQTSCRGFRSPWPSVRVTRQRSIKNSTSP